MTGHKISLGRTVVIKDGKLIRKRTYRSASAAIAAKKSPKKTWRGVK